MKQKTETATNIIKLTDLAEWSGFAERHLRDLSAAGHLPPINRGELPFTAIAMLFKYLRRDSEELIRQKLLKTTADRKVAEIEAEVAAGKFSSVEIFNRSLIAFGQAANRAITAQEGPLQKAICAELPGVMDHQVRTAVQNSLDKLRAALADAWENAEEPKTEAA